jgi:hypothetical protein
MKNNCATVPSRIGEPTPKLRWYQFRLRQLFTLMGATAGFSFVASELGWVDAAIILLALMVLISLMRRPRRVHLATTALLTLITVVLLWANLRPTAWQRQWNQLTPTSLDPITDKMFWRGWPLCPFMLCRIHHMSLDPAGCFVQVALVGDGVLYVMALAAAKVACERCLRRRDRRKAAPDRRADGGTTSSTGAGSGKGDISDFQRETEREANSE